MWPFGKTKEKFLILDISSRKISGLLISLDDQRKIKKEKSWNNLEKRPVTAKAPLAPGASRVIAACDPELIFKIFVPLVMSRENRSEPVGRIELENLLAQAVGKIFNHYRQRASFVLGTDELDTILVGSNVSGFEADGHRVMSPVGFAPSEITAVMEMTFAARKTFERVKSIRRKGDVFFTEKGHSQASALRRGGIKKSDFLVIGEKRSHFYPVEVQNSSPVRNEIDWSVEDLISEVCRSWAVGNDAAASVYRYYEKNGVSGHLEKYLLKVLSAPLRDLTGRIKRMKTGARINLTGRVPLRLIGKNPFYDVPLAEFAARSGFDLGDPSLASIPDVFQQLAPFFEFYYDNSDNEINGWLKRRLNWLGSSV